LARVFGFLNLETGAMYRAFALKAMGSGVPLNMQPALLKLAAQTSIQLEPSAGGNRVLLDGVDVSGKVREPEVTAAASQVSVHPEVRVWMVEQQRALAANGGVVMEGRDIGTVVFPDAEVKLFLDASPEVRGERRFQQTGGNAGPESQQAVVAELRERDARDRNRAESPLRAAEDAIVLDSTAMTLDQVLARCEQIVRTHLERV
jgi:CMP/dCMP kinase